MAIFRYAPMTQRVKQLDILLPDDGKESRSLIIQAPAEDQALLA